MESEVIGEMTVEMMMSWLNTAINVLVQDQAIGSRDGGVEYYRQYTQTILQNTLNLKKA